MIFAPSLAARSTRAICFARFASASAEQAICVKPIFTTREELELFEFRFIDNQTKTRPPCSYHGRLAREHIFTLSPTTETSPHYLSYPPTHSSIDNQYPSAARSIAPLPLRQY